MSLQLNSAMMTYQPLIAAETYDSIYESPARASQGVKAYSEGVSVAIMTATDTTLRYAFTLRLVA